MNFMKNMICLCGALAAVLAGLILPEAVFGRSDRKLMEKVGVYEMETVELRAAAQVWDSLRLITGDYTGVKLSGGKELDEKGAFEAAEKGLRQMAGQLFADGTVIESFFKEGQTEAAQESIYEEEGIVVTDIADGLYRATPFLAVSEDNAVSAVIWEIVLYSERGSCRLLVDDQSAMVLAFSLQLKKAGDLAVEIAGDAARENSEDAAGENSGGAAGGYTGDVVTENAGDTAGENTEDNAAENAGDAAAEQETEEQETGAREKKLAKKLLDGAKSYYELKEVAEAGSASYDYGELGNAPYETDDAGPSSYYGYSFDVKDQNGESCRFFGDITPRSINLNMRAAEYDVGYESDHPVYQYQTSSQASGAAR